ncbi:putative ribonuclease H-like domain-containing protein [Tanacetum coccineum]
MQKNVLKHQFEKFSTTSNESLDKSYDRFQKLISQLEVHGALISKEDINQKFLRSLPSSWNQIALIMRNKSDIDEIDIDDLYNNLSVYEDELKRSSSSNSASQNLAFLSFENTGGTNEVSTASRDFRVSTASGINQVPSTPCAHDVAYSFLAQLTTSPQLENEDFQSGRNQERRSYGDNGRSNAPTTESSSQALVAQDCLGGYDWSNDFEVEPVNYALMAISSSSSSCSSDSEVQKCSKQCLKSFKTLQKNHDTEREKHNRAKLEIRGYEIALDSQESRILRHEKNELAWGEKYEFQNYELKCREIKINNLNLELEKVVKEIDELKDKIAKWEESTKNLDEILNSQMSARDKTESTPANDMSSKADEYHTVPPPIRQNFLTQRSDISFAGLDEYAIRNKIIESQTTKLNTKTSETAGKTNDANTEKPKSASESVLSNPKINRDRVIIEDWNSDDEEEEYEVQTVRPETQTVKTNRVIKSGSNSKKQGIGFRKVKACFVCKSTDHLIKDCNFHDKKSQEPKLKNVVNTSQREGKPVWDNTKRINHQKFSKYPHFSKTFVPSGVLTRTGLHRPSVSTARHVCTAGPSVSRLARPICTCYAHVLVQARPVYHNRPFTQNCHVNQELMFTYQEVLLHKTSFRPKDLKQDVKTFGIQNMTTVGTRAVVNTGKGKLDTNLTSLDGFWRHKRKYLDHVPKTPRIHSCSRMFTQKGISKLMNLNFKLLMKFQVVLRAPRKDDVYNLDLKNIFFPSGGLEKQLNHNVKIIRCDNGTEFKNYAMNEFCAKKGIKREFSVARTPQQNGVAERKNRTLIEALELMVLVTKPQNKTPYELLIGKLPSISFMRPFGCPLTILNTLDSLGKFDGKSDEGYLLGYSTSSKAFRVYNKRNHKGKKENLHMQFYSLKINQNVNMELVQQEKYKDRTKEYILLPLQPHRTRILVEDVPPAAHEKPSESSPKDNDVQDSEDAANKESEQDLQDELEKMVTQELAAKAMDDVSRQAFEEEKRRIASQKKAAQATSTNKLSTDRQSVSTDRQSVSTDRLFVSTDRPFVSTDGKIPIDASTLPNADLPINPNMPDLEDSSDTLLNDGIFNGAYDDEDVGAVADFNNMDNIIAVSPIPILKIHKDYPKGQILRDPTSVVQTRGKIQKTSSAQQALTISQALQDESWVEAMQEKLLQFKLQKVWVLVDLPYGKKEEVAILYGTIEEEVYVHQPIGFVDPAYPNKVYKVIKALYGLHQAPRAWYETLDGKWFQESQDKYVADILKKFDFLSIRIATTPIESNKPLVKDEYGVDVDVHVYRSMIGSLMYLTASRPDIMFGCFAYARYSSQIQKPQKASHLNAVKRIFRYLKHQPKLGLWYPRDSPFEFEAYSDSDYEGASLDRKSIIGGCQFLGRRLISWQCKKQTIMANSSTEAEYVAAANCCGQVLWIQNQMMDYRDCYEKRLIEVIKIHTDSNVADLLTKGFDVTRFNFLVVSIRLLNLPSPTTHIFDSILKGSGGNHGGQSSNDASLSGNEDGLTLQSVYDLCVSLCKQVTTQAKEIKALKAQVKKLKKGVKPLITHHKAWMKTRLARKTSLKKKGVHKDSVVFEEKKSENEGVSTEAPVSTDKQYEGTDKKNDGTDKQDGGTDSTKVSTDRQGEGTADQNEGKSVTQTAPTSTSTSTPTTPTPTVFGDDETIAQVLIIMSQNKEKLKEKEKGVEIRNIEDTERPRPTSTRSILTLRPLPKIDPKDKGKKRIEEEDESDTESEEITEAEKKFKQLANDEEVARKARINADKILAEELQKKEREKFTIEQRAKFLHDTHVGGKKHSKLKTKTFEEIQIKELNKEPEKKILKKKVVNEIPREEDIAKNNQQEWEIVRWRLYEACGVCILELKDGTVIYMLVERSHEMKKLESELWNHAMVEAGHAAYTDRFHELARLVPHLVTPESRMTERYAYRLALQIYRMVVATEPKTIQKAVQISSALTDEAMRNGSIKRVEKRGNVGEPSKDKNHWDDNKRTRTENAFATTVNPVGRENTIT